MNIRVCNAEDIRESIRLLEISEVIRGYNVIIIDYTWGGRAITKNLLTKWSEFWVQTLRPLIYKSFVIYYGHFFFNFHFYLLTHIVSIHVHFIK